MQLPILTFWLANITRLLSSLHTKQTGQTSSQTGLKAGVSGGIATYDLSVCADDLEAVGQGAYRDLFQLIHNKIQPLVGPFKCCSLANITYMYSTKFHTSILHLPRPTCTCACHSLNCLAMCC